MKEWHVKHMEQTLIKFVTGLSENASRWERRLNKKYGRIGAVCKRIEYDIKHGVTNKQVYLFLQLIRTDPSYLDVRTRDGSMERLDEIQAHFSESPEHGVYNDMWSHSVTRQQ
jgi:hypothetical protein